MEETGTLKAFSEGLSKEEMQYRDDLLVLMHQLSNIQISCCHKLEELLNSHSQFRHEVKHNHNQIKALVMKNMKNIWNGMSVSQVEAYCNETDDLEDLIMKFRNIKLN